MNYIINPEETITDIAKKYKVDVNDLCESNKGVISLLKGDTYSFSSNNGMKNLVVHHNFKPGDIIKHFKRDLVSEEEQKMNKYLYKVLAIAKHTETMEDMLVYQALYYPFDIYTRPMKMVHEKAPIERYSDEERAKIKNIYRLEYFVENN